MRIRMSFGWIFKTGLVVCLVAISARAEVKGLQGPWLSPGETLLCFGDSLTAHGGYVRELSAVLEPMGVKVVNGGQSGDKTPTALMRLAKVVDETRPDAIFIFFGANDAAIGHARWGDEPKVSPVTYRDNLEWIVHWCRQERNISKFSIAPPTGPIEGPNGYPFGDVRRAYCLMAREAADNMKAVFVPLDCEFERARAKMAEDAKGLKLTTDGIHLNAEGNKVAAKAMLKAWNVRQ